MKVLIVEDHPLIRLSYKNIIKDYFEEVIFFEADNIIDTSKYLEEYLITFAIVDLNLKGISGFNVIKHLKAKQPSCKIIVISLYDEIETVWLCKKLGANGFIPKTSDEKMFVDVIKNVLYDSNNDVFITTDYLNEKLLHLFSDDIDYFFEEFSTLTDKEKMVFKLKIHNYKNIDISKILDIKLKTVENYITRISTKCIPKNYTFNQFLEKYQKSINFIVSNE